MKKIIYILLLILCTNKLFAQNLVPNYSFETHSNCPSGSGGISLGLATFFGGGVILLIILVYALLIRNILYLRILLDTSKHSMTVLMQG